MIETFKDMKHGKSGSQYESAQMERTASQILHQMGGVKENEDSLESTRARVLANAKAIYGSTRNLDIISFAPSSSRKIGAAIVEHQPTGRSYIHCSSAKEDCRLAAVEHLLVITEDILASLIDREGITSSGWLPATTQSHHAATYNAASMASSSTSGSANTSLAGSRRSSVQPAESYGEPSPTIHHHHHAIGPHHQQQHSSNSTPINPLAMQVFQQKQPELLRNSSFDTIAHIPQPTAMIPRTASDLIAQPRPVPAAQYQGPRSGGRGVQWNLGSEG